MIYSRAYYPEITNPWNADRANNAYNYKEEPASLLSWLGISGLCGSFSEKRKPLRNKKNGCFSVIVSELLSVATLSVYAIQKGLTVRGDGSANSKKNLIANIRLGDIITFGASSSFDVDYTTDPEYVKDNNLIPIYDIVEDYDIIKEAIEEMSKEKAKLSKKAGCPEEPLYCHLKGSKPIRKEKEEDIIVASSWIKVGSTIIPKFYNDNIIIM